MELARKLHQLFACVGLDAGGVDDSQLHARESLGGDVVQHIKGVVGGALAIFVVADQAATEIGRDDFCTQKMGAREGRFAAARRANQDDEAEVRDGEVHGWSSLVSCPKF